MRFLEGRSIGNCGRIEHHDIGVIAILEQTASLESQIRSRQTRQLADRILQGKQLLPANVHAQQSREVAVCPRVRHRLEEHALRRLRRLVRSETYPRQLDQLFYV